MAEIEAVPIRQPLLNRPPRRGWGGFEVAPKPAVPQNKPPPENRPNQATSDIQEVANAKANADALGLVRGELAAMQIGLAVLGANSLHLGIVNPVSDFGQEVVSSSLESPKPKEFSIKGLLKRVGVSIATNVIIASLHLI